MNEKDGRFFSLFYERNKDSYVHGPKPKPETIEKYRSVLPEALIRVWETFGFGIFEKGVIQFVDPDEWNFIWDYSIDKYFPAHVIGHTSLGDLITISGYGQLWNEDTKQYEPMTSISMRYFHENKIQTVGLPKSFALWLGVSINEDNKTVTHDYFCKKYKLEKYYKVKDKLGPLRFGQCYGYVPLPELGGAKSYKNLQVLDAKSYVEMTLQVQGPRYDKK